MEVRNLTKDDELGKIVTSLLNNVEEIDDDYPELKKKSIREAWKFLRKHPEYSWGDSWPGLLGRQKTEVLRGKDVICIWEEGGFDGTDYGTISLP